MTGSPSEILDWLLGCAVRFEYGEKVEVYNKQTSDMIQLKKYVFVFKYYEYILIFWRNEQPKIVSNNPLDNLDFTTPEFKAGVNSLADSLQVNSD